MIAPNCVLVAFSHGFRDLNIPMIDQPYEDAAIIIDDDVWIGANCTITKGVRFGKGCIVGANSLVTKDVEPYSIVGGVPAKVIGTRKLSVDVARTERPKNEAVKHD
jgi:galactoside O-acetyltransferase